LLQRTTIVAPVSAKARVPISMKALLVLKRAVPLLLLDPEADETDVLVLEVVISEGSFPSTKDAPQTLEIALDTVVADDEEILATIFSASVLTA